MSAKRGPLRPLFFICGILVGAAAGLGVLRRLDVVEVDGRSMAPALLPGDRLVVEAVTYAARPPLPGEIVLAPDPRSPSRELIKRVAAVHGDRLELRGDAPQASTDSRAFGELPLAAVRWRAVARYWPLRRLGPL